MVQTPRAYFGFWWEPSEIALRLQRTGCFICRKRVDLAPNRMVANLAPRLVDDEPGLERSLREGRR